MGHQSLVTFTLVIPHRDRGQDWRRQANLDSAVRWWRDRGIEPLIVDDGGVGDDQFNRSAAYNIGLAQSDTDVVVFAEADLLVELDQIETGVELAAEAPGMVVPFSTFMAMDPISTNDVRARIIHPKHAISTQQRGNYKSIGAVNIVSRTTMDMIGGRYDPLFAGHAYDDDAMAHAFTVCCGPLRFVDGPGWHQYHLPGAYYATPASTADDLAATEANRQRYELYKQAVTPTQIRHLIRGNA